MDKKLTDLKDQGAFSNIQITDLGHGTFLLCKEDQQTSTYRKLIDESNLLKSKSEKLLDIDLKAAKVHQIESVFIQIRAILLIENERTHMEIIMEYKTLCRYINKVCGFYTEIEHSRFRMSMKYILFNIKFHYLQIENMLMIRSVENSKNVQPKHFLYFLNEYKELGNIFEESAIENFMVVRLADLEETIKTKMRITKVKNTVN